MKNKNKDFNRNPVVIISINIFYWIKNFLNNFNLYLLFKDIVLYLKISSFLNFLKKEHKKDWEKIGFLDGWGNNFGLLKKLDHEYKSDTIEIKKENIRRKIKPAIDFLTKKYPDIGNYIKVEIEKQNVINDEEFYSIKFSPFYHLLSFGWFLKIIIYTTIITIIIISNYDFLKNSIINLFY